MSICSPSLPLLILLLCAHVYDTHSLSSQCVQPLQPFAFHLSVSEVGRRLDVVPLPECSPFTSHVSLQGLSLPPVYLSVSLSVHAFMCNVTRLPWTVCWDEAFEGLNGASF